MTRQWSDGAHDDEERLAALDREWAQANKIGSEIADLRVCNEWLRLQLAGPWRIDNYRARAKSFRAEV